MCILDYIVIRFEPDCAAASVNKYQSLNQTVDLKDEVMFTVRDALNNADCGQVIVIITRNIKQLLTMKTLDEYIQRGAKFLCLSDSQDDRDLVIWLNDYLSKVNSPSRIYIAMSPEPLPQFTYRGKGALQVIGRVKRALPVPMVKSIAPIAADYKPNKPWYGKHSKQR